jgi:hypothetical protein
VKKRLFLVLAVPIVALTFGGAQQNPDLLKNVSLTQASLPAPNSTTAFNPYWAIGRGYWKGNRLVFIDPHVPRVDLYDKDSMVSSTRVKFSESADARVYDAIVTSTGRLLVAGSYQPGTGDWHGFVGFPDAEGQVSPIVDTGSFSPTKLSTCDDGATVWTIGWSRNSWNSGGRKHEPYDALRQYSFSSGRLLVSTLDTATFPKFPEPGQSGLSHFPDLMMQCHDKTLGIYEGSSDEWIEYNTDTNKLSRWKLPKRDHPWVEYDSSGKELPYSKERTIITGMTMLHSGEVYASFEHEMPGKDSVTGLFRLIKSGNQGTWRPVQGAQAVRREAGAFNRLEGTDGKNLVYSRFGEHNWFFSSAP